MNVAAADLIFAGKWLREQRRSQSSGDTAARLPKSLESGCCRSRALFRSDVFPVPELTALSLRSR